ncbi:MAG: DUF4180 domain-containing protein [Devosia sp.]
MTAYALPATGPLIAAEADASDIIGEAYSAGADAIVIPVARLSPDFFKLSTGLAGAILQKLTNYQFSVTIVGDISAYTEKSAPLRDFVRESNRHGGIRFVSSEDDL